MNERQRKLCKMLGCKVPVMLAGMGGIASPELVAAVTNAGGFGTFGSAMDVKNKNPEELLAEIKEISNKCNGLPFGIDILVHGAEGGVMKELIDIFAEGGAKLFVSGKGFPRKQVIDTFHSKGMLVASIAGKVNHAVKAVEAGVDIVIVQGACAGGHTGEQALSVLLPSVVDAVGDKVPVVAAGGIFDARGAASAYYYGASGVWVGTRFMLSTLGNVPEIYKERLLAANSDETVVTKAYTGATMRVLKNPYVMKYVENPSLLEPNSGLVAARAWADGCWKVHSGDINSEYCEENQAYVCGQNVGAIDTILTPGEIVRDMAEGAQAILTSLPAQVLSPDRSHFRASKLCQMLGCDVPIMLAGMGGIASKELVAAVTNAGGFGTWGSAVDVKNKGPEELLAEVKEISTLCNGKPFGVDILIHGGDGGVMPELIDIFAEGGAKLFVSGKGYPRTQVIEKFHSKGMYVASIAGKLSHAVNASKAGVDIVIVQGCEGGGHTGAVELGVLLPQVVDALAGSDTLVVAAGGICCGRSMASAFAMGACGVWVGTRFMMTHEAKTHPKYKARLLQASSDDTTTTKAYTGSNLRVLRNPYIKQFEGPNLENNSALVAARAWKDGCWKLHSGDDKDYSEDNQAYVVGQNIGRIQELKPAAEVVHEMANECIELLINTGLSQSSL